MDRYIARCQKKLKAWNAPLENWRCVDLIDGEDADFQCELCGYENVRYIHVMEHDEYFERLSVGCICAGIMEGDILAAKERDRKMKNRSKRKLNFPNRKWKTARSGAYYVKYRDQYVFCVFSSEWDRFAQKTYRINFGEMPAGDITQIESASIPDFDILLGGFPCQPFSSAGLKKGFADTRGTLFFEIERIMRDKRPKVFLLENVKQLQTHDRGRTLKVILSHFDDVKELIIENFMEPEFREPLSEFLDLNTLADRLEKVNTVTVDYKAPTGQWMQARFIAKRRDENGRAKEILYVARDITLEKMRDLEQQEALINALAAAQQANKAKTTFLNSMSHDIRTPMNAIIGFTALAQTHIEEQAQVQDYLGKISTSSTHLLSLINDILDMSRIESGTVKLDEKAVHIPDLLHDLRTMIQSLVNSKNLNLFIDTQDVVHEDVLTDKLRLNQVLLNIVSNAIKFTKPGGDIIIRLVEKPCNLKHYTTYEFSVKDNGIGMAQEFLEHIFETFTREYSATVSGIQGTGLGMAITKNIVDMMGGDIQVESEEGKGSLFTVTLNLRLANEPVKNEPIPALLGARALIVDDDINTCRSVSKMLRDIEMRPDWTASGKEAILRAQDAAELKDEYKVYIIDYLMPDMNGIETVRRIRKVISEDVPIIVLTAYDWADFEYEARQAGVTAFVSKPIFMSELRAVLTQPIIKEGIEKEKEKKKTYDYSDKRVLLVEDNELNREIATAILEETGMIIDSVNDGDVAVSAINGAPADKYDLILMDVQMPKMDGYTATREIRTLPDNRKANIPIVAMTANAFDEDRKKAFEAGMNGHIIKPISIDEIAKVLDEIFAEKK